MNQQNTTSGGIGLLGLTFLLLLAIKLLANPAALAWWHVFVPLWIVPAFLVAVALICGVLWLLFHGLIALIEFANRVRMKKRMKARLKASQQA